MEFREYVAQKLEEGEAELVGDPVGCPDIPSRVAAAEALRNRALVFRNLPDKGFTAVGNLYGTSYRLCQAFGARDYAHLFADLDRAIGSPREIRRAPWPSSEYQVLSKPNIEALLPVARYCQGDGTPYITSGIVLARFPGSRRRHVCYMRFAVLGGNRLLANPATPRIIETVKQSVGRGEELDICILIGVPPEISLMACVSMPGEQDKLEVAQSMSRGELAFSPDELPLPLSTEFVLKARIIPEYAPEGPFGEVGGMYSVKDRNPVCVVDELWHRSDAVFHSLSAGMAKEHLELVALGPRACLERLQRKYPQIIRYDLPAFGGDRLAVLAVRGALDVSALREQLWDIPIVRGFVFVNEDLAGNSAAEVLWAILQRAGNSDHFSFSESRHPLYHTDKFCVDATVKDTRAWEHRRIDVYRKDF